MFLEDISAKIENKPNPALTGSRSVEQFLSTHQVKLNSLKSLVGNPPSPGVAYFIWTDKSFNAFTFIPYFIKEYGYIKELVISTYSINQRILDSFSRYINMGKIQSIILLLSETMKFRNPKVADQLAIYANTHKDIIRFHFGWNHSKITLLNCGDQFFTAEGSGNWSENSRHEQYVMINSQKVFEFRKNCIIHATE